MERVIISEYQLKDMIVRYIKDEKDIVSLQLFPAAEGYIYSTMCC